VYDTINRGLETMPRPRLSSNDLSISQLENMLAARRAKLGALERQRQTILGRLNKLDAKIVGLGGGASGHVGKVSHLGPRRRARNDKSLAEVILDVLTKHGGPMAVKDIIKAALATGYKSTSPQFRNIVNQQLIKNKRFTGSSRGVYQLKK
jgi:hypothetical protein